MKTDRPPHTHSLRRAAVATAAAVGLLLTSATLATSAGAAPLPAAPTTAMVNPFSVAHGFTLVSFGDVELSNAELEGSVAARGDLTWAKGSTYPIVHRVAGGGSYTIPVVDGRGVRALVGGLDFAGSNEQLAVTSAGWDSPAPGNSLNRGWLLTESADWTHAHDRAGSTELFLNGASDVNTTPLVQQMWNGGTFASAADAAAGLVVPAGTFDRVFDGSQAQAAAWSESMAALVPNASVPDWSQSEVDLVTTAAAGPHVLQLTSAQVKAWGSTKKIRVGGGSTTSAGPVSAAQPLVINVLVKDGDVLDLPSFAHATVSSTGAPNIYAPYILWNIVPDTAGASVQLGAQKSALSGSIYAPTVNLTTNFDPSEGQVVAASLTGLAGSGEYHHYGFMGLIELPLGGPTPVGGFSIAKTVAGDPGASVSSFSGTWTCSAPNLTGASSGTWTLAGGATTTIAGFPVGTSCAVTENPVTGEANGTWTAALDRPSITVVAGTGTAPADRVTVTNTFTAAPTTGPGTGGNPGGGGNGGGSTGGGGPTGGSGGADPGTGPSTTPGAPGPGGTSGSGSTGSGNLLPSTAGGTPGTSVAPAAGKASTSASSTLPLTGSNPIGVVALALALVALGAGALGLARVRRRTIA